MRADGQQEAALVHLERLHGELLHYEPTPPVAPPPPKAGKEWRGPQMDAFGEPTGGGAMGSAMVG